MRGVMVLGVQKEPCACLQTRGLNVLYSELRLIPGTVHLQMQNV